MAITVSILRQPLYGSVVWNGNSFVYTPNVDYSGSDSFVYSEYINGVKSIYTKYVNSSNLPPVAITKVLSVTPYTSTQINIDSVVQDYTNPFNYVKFVSAYSSINNLVTTDGNSLYYKSSTSNVSDIITYTATDKQFTITGTISVNVLSASGEAGYNYSPLEKLRIYQGFTSSYQNVSAGWTGSYDVYVQYGSTWDSIDLATYEGFANLVVDRYAAWSAVYDFRNIYYSVYATVTSQSGRWADDTASGNYYYGIINPKALNWNNIYSISNINSGDWNSSISTYNILSSGLDYTQPYYDTNYNTVTSSSADLWDTSELNDWRSNNFNLLRNTYTNLTAISGRLIDVLSSYVGLSSDISSVIEKITNTGLALQSNSADFWDNSNLDSLSAEYYDKWTASYVDISLNKDKFDEFSILLNSISSAIDSTNTDSNLLLTTVSANSALLWYNDDNETYLSINSGSWDNLYLNLTSNSGNWYASTSIISTINNDKDRYNDLLSVVSANSAGNWGSSDTSFLSNSANLDLIYTILTANSSDWGATNTISNIIAAGSALFELSYTTVQSKSADAWGDSDDTLIHSNSGNWNSVYTNLTSNSSNWNPTNNVGTIIGSISSIFQEVYNTVNSNSGSTWSNSNDALLSSNSGNWVDSYNIINTSSASWNYGDSLSAIIDTDKISYDSTYNTLTSNSSNNWTGMSIYQSVSNNVNKFENLKNLFFSQYEDSLWSSVKSIYDIIFDRYNYYYPYYNSNVNTVQANSSNWDTVYLNSILSPLSSNLESNYNSLTANSSYWKFEEDQNLKNTFSYVSSNSAKLNSSYDSFTSKLSSWTPAFDTSIVADLSANYLSGSSTTNISSRNLNIFGNLVVAQNISALGSKTSINTSNYSLTAFEVTDTSSSDCFVITKSSNLLNVATFSSVSAGPVLWIKSDNTVSINTTLGNQALNVMGDISASGVILNYLGSQISLLQSNSAKYEAAYTFLTANSGNITSFDAAKSDYDQLTNYYNTSSTTINTLTANIPIYTTTLDLISSNYNRNEMVNNFVTYSASNINVDSELRSLTGNYDSTYNTLTSSSSNQLISLNYLFSFNKVVSSDKAKLVIPYNIRIDSWSVFADQSTTLAIEVLSGYTFNKTTRTVSITNNKPISATSTTKASANELDTLGWTTNIKQGGFIQFNLTKNDSASAVMVNLKAYKI